MTNVTVKFPFTIYLDDYHEGRYVAKILGDLVGQKVAYEELSNEERAHLGYKFAFDVVASASVEEFSEFSKKKEAFIAP